MSPPPRRTDRAEGDRLPEPARRLHRALLEALLATGEVPSRAALAGGLGIGPDGVGAALDELAAADYAAFDGSGRPTCLYPFSASQTPHAAVVDGRRRHAMCAIDLLGIPAMLGRELALEGRCAACGAGIGLRVRPGAVVVAEPAAALVVARRDESAPAFAACCPFTVFACGPAHAARLAERISGVSVLPLNEALAHAEALFGDLLRAPTLPVARRRGRGWDPFDAG
jgi:hypothetical protein